MKSGILKSLILIPLGWSCGQVTEYLLSMYSAPVQAPEPSATKEIMVVIADHPLTDILLFHI